MYLNISYDTDFIELMLFLKAKYGQKMFDLDGIGVQLDINNFSKDFFNNKTTTADISIDSNSNISTKDMIVYNTELPKSYFRLNAYYLIWKKLKQLYSRVEANKIIEMQLSGDIYINDFHGINMAYSYHPHTTIIIKINNEIKNITMESLFSELSFFIENNENCDFINTSKLNIDILDNGKWVKLNRILRHISHTDLLRIETKRGAVSVITEDHPVILKDGSEKLAINICEADELLSNSRYTLQGTKKVNNNIAYIIGAMIGDGYVSNGKCVLVQNDIVNTHFYKLIKDNYTHVNVEKINRLNFGTIDTAEEYSKLIGLMALNKHLPYDFLEWDYESRLSLISGLIDTDGTINKRNGVVDVRLISFAAIQQIAELASSLGFNRIRTSIVNKQKESHKSYKNNYKLYRVSFRVNNKDIIKKSIKIKNNIDIAFKIAGVDGRWESDFINKIDKIEWKGDFVYDVTTETGTFYNNGLTVHNCYNYSTYDIALNGLSMVNKIYSIKPKYLYSFKSQLEQFVVIASNSTLGAVGLADLFIVMGHYIDNILDTLSDAGFNFKATEDCWKYIKENIVSFIYTINQPSRANQCVTEDTEVLTPNGFKTYNELKINDEIYTWDNGKLNIQHVDNINIYDYDGPMHKYSGRDTVQVVTPTHKVLYKKNNSNKYLLKESLELINEKTPLTYPVAMLNDNREDYNISDTMLKLCVMILTDGNINKQEGKSLRFSLFKSPNRWGNEEIVKTLDELNIKYNYRLQKSEFGLVNVYEADVESSKEVILLLNNTKSELPQWLTKLSKRQAKMVIDLWSKFDGHIEVKNYNKQKCQCDNFIIADQLQHICFLSGKGSKIVSRKIGNNKEETIYLIPYNRVNKNANKKEIISYKGKVWCPTTKDGVVVFRKNGMIFISGNSPFTNVSIFDDVFLNKLVPEYIFENGKSPKISTIKKIQEIFMDTMNEELRRTPVTFPITTACFAIDENNNIIDKDFLNLIAEKNIEFGFINLYCGKTSTLSSCCRLRSETDNEYFNSFGSGSTQIGSLGVVTVNLPRLAYKYNDKEIFIEELINVVDVVGKINNAKRHIIKKKIDGKSQPLYNLGFMDINRQYSTCGLNGINESLQLLGFDILTDSGIDFAISMFDVINKTNERLQKQYKAPHNCEQTPSENSSIKLAKKDELLDYNTGFVFYSNQFIPLITKADMLDRIEIQGKFDKHFSGGSICHINVEDRISDFNDMALLIETCAKMGVIYFAINYNLQKCKNNHMTVGKTSTCSICTEPIEASFTRVVGFLTAVKNWNEVRRTHDYPNRQFYGSIK